ncbi:hypothetical protein SEA_ABT2GRADUATEX2_9 [Streptomyces phage Abt2graduatex2]|nr:hypothetical protein SEA_ABT2GRADUATEX2_9 [Streptomyces phage Abt2graduatex2]
MQSLTTLAVLGFAAYRATQLVVWDTIGDRLRDRLELWHAAKHTSRFRTFVRQLIGCPYCAGWWLSMITVLVYLTAAGQWGSAPLIVHAVEAWAVAGIQALLNRWDDSRPGHEPKGH